MSCSHDEERTPLMNSRESYGRVLFPMERSPPPSSSPPIGGDISPPIGGGILPPIPPVHRNYPPPTIFELRLDDSVSPPSNLDFVGTPRTQPRGANVDEQSDPSEINDSLGSDHSLERRAELKFGPEQSLPERWNRVVGVLMVVSAGILFTCANVLQNLYLKHIDFYPVLFYRAVLQLCVTFCYITFSGITLFPRGHRALITLQGLIGGVLLMAIFTAVTTVPLGNASAIFFCTPVFTFILGTIMLKERMAGFRILISIIMITGVILISRPPMLFGEDAPTTPKNQPSFTKIDFPKLKHPNSTISKPAVFGLQSRALDLFGILAMAEHRSKEEPSFWNYFVAVLVPIFSAVLSILTRTLKGSQGVSSCVLMFWLGIGAMAVAIGGSIIDGSTSKKSHYDLKTDLSLLGVSMCGIMGNGLYTVAMQWVSPTRANTFRSFEVILNYALQIFLQGFPFYPMSLWGIGFLFVAMFGIGFERNLFMWLGARSRLLANFW